MEFDTLLVNARIADVFRYRLFEGWIGIRDGRFITVEAGGAPGGIRATETQDLAGAHRHARLDRFAFAH